MGNRRHQPAGRTNGAPARASRRQGAEAGNGSPAYGAIDLGTNNCRLLVAVPEDDSFRVIDSFSRIVRLGEGLAGSGGLCDDAMDRTLSALKVCAGVMKRQNVTRYRAVATKACRRGGNAPDFVARVADETGIELETVSCEDEVNLTFAGCGPLLDRNAEYGLVLDIGGGSSELMWIEQNGGAPKVAAYHSIPEGVVTLTERYGGDCVCDSLYDEIMNDIDTHLDRFPAAEWADQAARGSNLTMLGTSGTVTTLGALHLGLRRYERSRVDGMVIDFDSIRCISGRLAAMTCNSRASHPCIGAERADLVVMGCAILEAVCRRWPVGRLRVADRGIREGLLQGMMAEDGWYAASRADAPASAPLGEPAAGPAV